MTSIINRNFGRKEDDLSEMLINYDKKCQPNFILCDGTDHGYCICHTCNTIMDIYRMTITPDKTLPCVWLHIACHNCKYVTERKFYMSMSTSGDWNLDRKKDEKDVIESRQCMALATSLDHTKKLIGSSYDKIKARIFAFTHKIKEETR
jgi:hypothetical protein